MKKINSITPKSDHEICINIVRSYYRMINKKVKQADGTYTVEQHEVLLKQLKSMKSLRWDAITSIDPYYNSKNKMSPQRCIIFDKYTNTHFIAWHSMDEVREMIYGNGKLNSEAEQIGFKVRK